MDKSTPSLVKMRYGFPPRSPLHHPAVIVARSTLAFILALALLPFTVAAWLHLPSCLAARFLERLSVSVLMLIARIAAVEVLLRPRFEEYASSDSGNCTDTKQQKQQQQQQQQRAWLPAPLVRFWTSPLPRGRFVRTYDQPGRWMSDAQLETLRATLEQVAVSSVGSIPTHRLFDRHTVRSTLTKRVVSVAFDGQGALGFTAMVYMDGPDEDVVVHLGLTMIGNRGRGTRLQSALCTKSLLMACVNLRRMSYNVTNCAASPAGIGGVGDYFLNCFPTYDASAPRQEHHVRIARHVLAKYRYEFGCSKFATFDERTFVVHKSNAPEGGGTHEFIKEDGSPVSQYKVEACNKFVARMLDLQAGDELFQVATVNLIASVVKFFLSSRKSSRRSGAM